eukprot:7084383-Pyramimonas_sp.AAC.1
MAGYPTGGDHKYRLLFPVRKCWPCIYKPILLLPDTKKVDIWEAGIRRALPRQAQAAQRGVTTAAFAIRAPATVA